MKTVDHSVNDSIYQRVLLSPLGLDKDNSAVLWILLLFASMLSAGMYYFDGNVALVTGILYLTFVLLLSLFRIDYSLYLFIFTVLLFEQFAIPGFPAITHDVSFFSNLKEISYVPFLKPESSALLRSTSFFSSLPFFCILPFEKTLI